ncbi:MAG: hypothetical protein Kow0031_21610 [Anaerolineae bacterium]
MNKITTSQLVDLLTNNKGKYVEASLNNGFFSATHLLVFGGQKIFDTGIDSQEISWKPEDFIRFYPEAYWVVDQIVT